MMLASAFLLGSLTTACAKYLPATALGATFVAPPAYEWAASAARVPASILFAIARAESGMPIHGRWIPWPWTLNVAAVPYRFASQEEACAALKRSLRNIPSRRIDVGLTQIDFSYYGDRVATPCDLLNPYLNLLLAARILNAFHREGDDWMLAVGRYHRPAGGEPAEQYRRQVAKQLAQVLKTAGDTRIGRTSLP